ncbi:hypothetical protein EDB86DRAFT_68763 [Lactarius hatsudake]|nr:hypothetical protein EDB86DRAFT_68763 [Lactarius hatsudake]
MSAFGGGCEKRAILEGFSWDNKGLHKHLSMRRRAKAGSADVLVVPDIRTLYVLFVLSFVNNSAASSVKYSFLEQRQDVFRSILAGLYLRYSLARRILEVAWTGIWLDPKIKRTLKVNVFNEKSLHHTVQQACRFTDRLKIPDTVYRQPEHSSKTVRTIIYELFDSEQTVHFEWPLLAFFYACRPAKCAHLVSVHAWCWTYLFCIMVVITPTSP